MKLHNKTTKLITDQNVCLPGYKLLNILQDLHIPPRACNTQHVNDINSLNKVLPIPFFFDHYLTTVTSNENEAV